MTVFLSEVQLEKAAPSIFAPGGSSGTSSRYGFIPTIDVVRGLKTAGFHPVKAVQARNRVEARKDYGKHMIRFRHESNLAATKQDGLFSEIVLVNSHDGSTSYQLRAGVYRLVCMNGLIVGEECFERRVKHQGNVVEKVVEAAHDLIEISPISVRKAQEWQEIGLTRDQKQVFAQTALQLKWDGDEVPLSPAQVLNPRRLADERNDLWTTFNVIQENIVQGGIRYRTEAGTRQRTRGVSSVSENVRLNTALWALTERMAQLAK